MQKTSDEAYADATVRDADARAARHVAGAKDAPDAMRPCWRAFMRDAPQQKRKYGVIE